MELVTTSTLQEVIQRLPRSNLRVCYIRLVCPKKYINSIKADVSKASAKVQDQIPGRAAQAKKEGEKWASEAGAKIDSTVSVLMLISHTCCVVVNCDELRYPSSPNHATSSRDIADFVPIRQTKLAQNSQRPRASSINTARMLPIPQ